MREALSSPEWLITEDGFDPERANVRETLVDAFTSDFNGLKVIIAEGECQLERQRRIKPWLAGHGSITLKSPNAKTVREPLRNGSP